MVLSIGLVMCLCWLCCWLGFRVCLGRRLLIVFEFVCGGWRVVVVVLLLMYVLVEVVLVVEEWVVSWVIEVLGDVI